ncbi:MAG: hypothetical protein COZ80_06375 [Ignavibacteria bacterium CG_4_8_14_3_um_filter_37_9]|nr:hypothetical protein [Ignavibacteria bacterium]OIO13988.1 MAG: hypothetical protein AUJ54_15200 [Ignavibacteria bacterium CG1_02_37_35]PIS44782.1 MAG: hypothetical protein COT22_08690 [Ignavibacteria bacterium CG08_land_8_20_14_0_20_37_9]PIW99251.1 MAG: hypothetical protein COZ80_06375 [Ignavibacteria bacterium CG_4_8_14_3_um_filter_37_9]PIX94238.1 MAG: hypothetical protein COZ25_06585 [Ignavibacteria bacterium CG_4_10_14_3_um_filter_37_18]PJC57648.1 MAG: hypothetical protein CO025_12320 [I
MDNLINILVAAIIIYSFLAPLFKKKKGDADASPQSGRSPYNQPAKTKPSYQNRDLDIFTEIEEMMNRGKIPPVEHLPTSEDVDSGYSDEHHSAPIEHRATPTEDRVGNLEKKVNYDYRKFKISEKDRLSLERDLEKQFTSQRKVYSHPTFERVRNSFRNKADFRNGFIISEILGKPKALSR